MISSVDIAVGSKVRALRKAQGWSVPMLAKRLAITERRLTDMESGHERISASMLISIAEALNVRVGELLSSI
jgi:transcriptional regulator with XRE-family HTH domain